MSSNFQIRKVVVLVAGVMGAQIAAHLVKPNVCFGEGSTDRYSIYR